MLTVRQNCGYEAVDEGILWRVKGKGNLEGGYTSAIITETQKKQTD